MKIYIQANSKAEINRKLKALEIIKGIEYSMFNEHYMTERILNDQDSGTTVAIFSKMSNNQPISKAWGEWDKEKMKLI